MHRISVRHNFESAHRLSHPDSSHKCQSIHGHSWWVTIWIEGGDLDERGMLVEYGQFKKAWRGFLDEKVDHHLILNEADAMVTTVLGAAPASRLLLVPFDPTTENLSRWLFERARDTLGALGLSKALTVRCAILDETATNSASFQPTLSD